MILFDDVCEVKNVDPEGKKFDKVSRLDCQCETYEMQILLDVNIDLYPIDVSDKFQFTLASTLNETDADDYGSSSTSLADKYEYVMYGKVFKYEEADAAAFKVAVYASFGGLLLMMKGDARYLQNIELDSRVYLLLRKTL
eukprot:TRINITY_DN4066_c0_g1_i4.p1 TRINITY_DN4066_c0_g1~~TRINITY_DN4066_c0_g1_i4.p1  ORF type:complete len:140 (+),score=35.75 TRINITY_DN4066_c0_g1_i4:142-561(+)